MHALVLFSSLLTLGAALPLESPVSIFQRATTPGTVYTKCSTPNTLALAYDDGPYQYTQSLVNTLNAAGAKGTFFFTGTLYGELDSALRRVLFNPDDSILIFQVASTIKRQQSKLPMRVDTKSHLTPGRTVM